MTKMPCYAICRQSTSVGGMPGRTKVGRARGWDFVSRWESWRGVSRGDLVSHFRNTRTTDSLRPGRMGEFLARWGRACAACAL
jgi:hypothetical protein